jgi:hypothetical protein
MRLCESLLLLVFVSDSFCILPASEMASLDELFVAIIDLDCQTGTQPSRIGISPFWWNADHELQGSAIQPDLGTPSELELAQPHLQGTRKGLLFAIGAFLMIMNIKAATFQPDLGTPPQWELAQPGVYM